MKNKKAFTLVELIVVVTILAILGTIGFVSYSSYLTGVRDANRVASLDAIANGLSLYETDSAILPLPDDAVTISATLPSVATHAYQGDIGTTVLETIDYSKKGLDPKDKEHFGYFLTANRKHYQLVSFAEEADSLQGFRSFFIADTHAANLSNRYPLFYGDKLGMFIENIGDERAMNATVLGSSTRDISGGFIGLNLGSYDLHFSDSLSLSGNIDRDAYMASLSIGGITSTCKVLNARESLTSTGTYFTSSGGVLPNDCGPSS